MAGLPLRLSQWASSSSLLAETLILESTGGPVFTLIACASSWPVISSNRGLSDPRSAKD